MSVGNVGFPVTQIPIPEARGQTARQNPQTETVKPHVIQSTAADIQRLGQAFDRKLQFVVDHGSNDVIIKVIDRETDKVIKELPPEELQRLHNNLREAVGLLLNEMI
ncbi:MAG: flagellar protein FlaG [Treponema sp.]|nr:flagellar protein FlaG [Treponema sp.]